MSGAAIGSAATLLLSETDAVAASIADTVAAHGWTPQMFGALGDGVDDTDAIDALFAAVNAAGKGSIFFPVGTYRYTKTGTPGSVNLELTDITGLDIVFAPGAKLKLKADFVHSSSLTSAAPILRRCKNVNMINVEIDGDISAGTKTGTEQGEHAIQLFGCSDVFMLNCKFRDSANDGLYIDHTWSAGSIVSRSERFTVVNADCYNNGRQGLSVIGLFNSCFVNCTFRDTGNTGSFGHYGPGAGVDLEPNTSTVLAIDNVEFINPRIYGNIGGVFFAGGFATSSFDGAIRRVRIVNPDWKSKSTSAASDQIIMWFQDGQIEGGKIDLTEAGAGVPLMSLAYSTYHSKISIIGTEITAKVLILDASLGSGKTKYDQIVNIRDCRLRTIDATAGGYVHVDLETGGVFENNTVTIPATAYSSGTTRKCIELTNASVVGNRFVTDLADGSKQFTVNCGASAFDNSFSGRFGYVDTTRAAVAPAVGQGRALAGGQQLDLFDYRGIATGVSMRVFASYAVPSSGAWLRGDLVWNAQPSVGSPAFWVCVGSGSPGSWGAGPNLV